jgi:GNAT superfamily N-acetyltransferase
MPFSGRYNPATNSVEATVRVLPPVAVASFFVRRAQRNDAEGLASAERDALQSLFADSYPPDLLEAWAQRVTAESFRTAMDVGESYFVAIPQPHSRVILGLSSVRVVRDAFAVPVYVRQTAARQGVGRALHRLAEYEARARGATSLTIPAYLPGSFFYAALGYCEVGATTVRVSPTHHVACVTMQKRFADSR